MDLTGRYSRALGLAAGLRELLLLGLHQGTALKAGSGLVVARELQREVGIGSLVDTCTTLPETIQSTDISIFIYF